MIDYGTFQFAAPPRTGTTWFLKSCSMVGLGRGDKAHVHSPSPPNVTRLNVSLIRHPYDWLCSYYHALKGGSTGVTDVDTLTPLVRNTKDFSSFIHWYTKSHSGTVSRMFDSYNADTVMKTEELKWSVVEFFDSLNIRGKLLEGVKNLPPQNVGTNRPIKINLKLREKICEAESSFCNRYDYDISW